MSLSNTKGYSVIQDLSDKKYSQLRVKNPVIVFDMSSVKLDDTKIFWEQSLKKILESEPMKKVQHSYLESNFKCFLKT